MKKLGRFSPAEDTAIIQGRRAGLSWAEIGAQLERAGKNCQQRGERLLITADRSPRWAVGEIQQVAALLVYGATPADVRAAFPHRTYAAVRQIIFQVRRKIAARRTQ